MAEVAQQCSVGFVQRQTTLLAFCVVSLRYVYGDAAFVVAGQHLRAIGLRRVRQELEP